MMQKLTGRCSIIGAADSGTDIARSMHQLQDSVVTIAAKVNSDLARRRKKKMLWRKVSTCCGGPVALPPIS